MILDDITVCVTTAAALAAGVGAVASAIVAAVVYRSQTSPDVIAYVAPSRTDPSVALLYVENVGKAPAWDVRLEFVDNPPADLPGYIDAVCAFMDGGVPFLPPGGMRHTPLGPFPEFCGAMGFRSVDVEVSWSARKGGRKVSARFPFEAASFHGHGDGTAGTARKAALTRHGF